MLMLGDQGAHAAEAQAQPLPANMHRTDKDERTYDSLFGL